MIQAMQWIGLNKPNHSRMKIVLLALFFCPFSVLSLFAEEIVLIKSQDLPLYREAQEGFQENYPEPLVVLDLKGDIHAAEAVMLPLKKRPQTLVVAMGLLAARMVQEHLPNNSMVFSMLFDPERFSLSGGNRSGVTLQLDTGLLFAKIQHLFPNAKRIGVLYDPEKTAEIIQEAKQATAKQGLKLIAMPVPTEQALPRIARKLVDQIDLLWVIPDRTVISPFSLEFLLLLALERQIPTVGFSKDLVKRGMTAALSPDYKAIGKETAQIVLLMQRGKKDIPVRAAPKMLLSLNATTARKIGMTWDTLFLKAADVVYE